MSHNESETGDKPRDNHPPGYSASGLDFNIMIAEVTCGIRNVPAFAVLFAIMKEITMNQRSDGRL